MLWRRSSEPCCFCMFTSHKCHDAHQTIWEGSSRLKEDKTTIIHLIRGDNAFANLFRPARGDVPLLLPCEAECLKHAKRLKFYFGRKKTMTSTNTVTMTSTNTLVSYPGVRLCQCQCVLPSCQVECLIQSWPGPGKQNDDKPTLFKPEVTEPSYPGLPFLLISSVPYRTPPACAKMAAYPDLQPVILLPESIAAQVAYQLRYKNTEYYS